MMALQVKAWLFWTASGAAAASFALVVANALLVSSNQSIQGEVNQRQQFINQSIQLSRLNESLVRALATAAANTKDDKIRDLLAKHGITFTVSQPAAAPP